MDALPFRFRESEVEELRILYGFSSSARVGVAVIVSTPLASAVIAAW